MSKEACTIEELHKQNLQCPDSTAMLRICGQGDENLNFIESRLQVNIFHRGELLTVGGNDENAVNMAISLLTQMRDIALSGHRLNFAELRYALETLRKHGSVDMQQLYSEVVCFTCRGKPVRPRTQRQRDYIKAMADNTIIFGIGPAGTGKTYLAVCEAVNQLKRGSVSRIVLVRPAVEAGESLGFLPGDLREKVEPYLRPLYDAFFEILSPERFARYAEKNVIEIAPLAYMRGRTLNDSFIILDEAQNTTPEQMKMFLTRLGFGSKAVVTGDLTQVDLPNGKKSGLKVVQEILKDIDGISFVHLQNEDVVRHEIVQKVVSAYDRYEKMNGR
ncbi:MAG: PhoH family protein [Pyramidobacter sp.]|jgi:phosphate starvation-inducible PhoH-like protein